MTGTPSDPSRSSPAAGRGDGDVGGIAASAVGGLSDATQRSFEHGNDDATGLASTGHGTGGRAPRDDLGGKNEPGSAPGASGPGGAETAHALGAAPGASGPGPSTPGGSAAAGPSATSATVGAGSIGGAASGAGAGSASGRPASELDRSGKPPGEEGPLESLGRAVSEIVTTPAEGATTPSASRKA